MSTGQWIESDARWFEMRMLYCDLCGRVIPKHLWQVEVQGASRIFCNEACEALYREYIVTGSEQAISSVV